MVSKRHKFEVWQKTHGGHVFCRVYTSTKDQPFCARGSSKMKKVCFRCGSADQKYVGQLSAGGRENAFVDVLLNRMDPRSPSWRGVARTNVHED